MVAFAPSGRASLRTERIRSPGATQSGFIRPSAVGPRDEKNDVP